MKIYSRDVDHYFKLKYGLRQIWYGRKLYRDCYLVSGEAVSFYILWREIMKIAEHRYTQVLSIGNVKFKKENVIILNLYSFSLQSIYQN